MDSTNTSNLYPIRTVAQLTGINPVTLRAWERRHGLVVPRRTKTGHRVYSDEDIVRIKNILELLDQGISIGNVAHALEGDRTKIISDQDGEQKTEVWSEYQQAMLNSIANYDEDSLEKIYNDALSLYPIDIVTNNLLIPLLEQLGERWQTQAGNSAEEHFFSTYLRNKLGARFNHRNRNTRGPKLLCACIPGEQHEIGLLLFAITAHEYGYRPVVLGANTDLKVLPSACISSKCDALILSASIEPERKLSREMVDALVKQAQVPIFAGGAMSDDFKKMLESTGIVPLGKNIRKGMAVIEKVLKG